jgi:hypothetical protein
MSAAKGQKKPGFVMRAVNAPARIFGLGRSMEPAKEMGGLIVEQARQLLRPPSPDKVRHETFEEAVGRQGLTEERLAEALGNFQLRAKLSGILAACDLLLMLWWAYNLDIMAIIAAVAVLIAFVSTAITSSFRAWQIAHRQLVGFNEWISAPHPLDSVIGVSRGKR